MPLPLAPLILIARLAAGTAASAVCLQAGAAQNLELDKKVQAFLEKNRHSWRGMNVSEGDGKILYDLILKNNYIRALEIGTSTGHSGIWMDG